MNLQGANYVFIMDPHWNPSVEEQALSRAHRIGQKKIVTVFKMICSNTIEEKIIGLQEMKKLITKGLEATGVIPEEQTSMTEDEVKYLFDV